jgi:hypothetical protein
VTGEATPPRPPVRPAVALAFCLIGFVALVIAGLGLTSLATDSDVIDVPGFGQVAGAVGVLAAAIAFAGTVWAAVRRPRPSFTTLVGIVVGTWLAYVLVSGVAAGASAGDMGIGMAVSASLAVRWPGLVVAAAALVAGWSAVALVRTRASRPRWPWERDEDE